MYQRFVIFRYPARQGIKRIFTRAHSCANIAEGANYITCHIIMPAVISALYFNYMIISGYRTCNAYGMIGGFGAGGRNLYFINSWNTTAKQLGKRAFGIRRPGTHQYGLPGNSLKDSLVYIRIVMTQKRGRKTGMIIYVFVSFNVPYPAAFAAGETYIGL